MEEKRKTSLLMIPQKKEYALFALFSCKVIFLNTFLVLVAFTISTDFGLLEIFRNSWIDHLTYHLHFLP